MHLPGCYRIHPCGGALRKEGASCSPHNCPGRALPASILLFYNHCHLLKRLLNHLRWRWQMFVRIYWPQFWYALFLPARVQSGPFQGMPYTRVSTGSVILPKLLGTYENELHPFFSDQARLRQYDTCVDVGAGEGYYAVGLAWRYPHLRMIAFEAAGHGRRRIGRLARRNRVENRLKIRGFCAPIDLEQALSRGRKTLLIMDVEGHEGQLLDPKRVPRLAQTDFIVEVHPEIDPTLGDKICRWFEPTHTLQTVQQKLPKSIPESIQLSGALAAKGAYLTDEFRGPQFWIVGRVKAPPAS